MVDSVVKKHLKEEILEEVGGVNNDEDQHSGQVYCQDGIQDPPLEDDSHLNACVHNLNCQYFSIFVWMPASTLLTLLYANVQLVIRY